MVRSALVLLLLAGMLLTAQTSQPYRSSIRVQSRTIRPTFKPSPAIRATPIRPSSRLHTGIQYPSRNLASPRSTFRPTPIRPRSYAPMRRMRK